jgi:hypothetical protein
MMRKGKQISKRYKTKGNWNQKPQANNKKKVEVSSLD